MYEFQLDTAVRMLKEMIRAQNVDKDFLTRNRSRTEFSIEVVKKLNLTHVPHEIKKVASKIRKAYSKEGSDARAAKRAFMEVTKGFRDRVSP